MRGHKQSKQGRIQTVMININCHGHGVYVPVSITFFYFAFLIFFISKNPLGASSSSCGYLALCFNDCRRTVYVIMTSVTPRLTPQEV